MGLTLAASVFWCAGSQPPACTGGFCAGKMAKLSRILKQGVVQKACCKAACGPNCSRAQLCALLGEICRALSQFMYVALPYSKQLQVGLAATIARKRNGAVSETAGILSQGAHEIARNAIRTLRQAIGKQIIDC